MKTKKGKLYLIPSFLGHADKTLIPEHNLNIIHRLNEFIVENEKPARAFLKSCETPISLSEIILHPIHKHVDPLHTLNYLDSCNDGKDIGLISDAGLPCVADPGYQMVSLAHSKNIEVVPLNGLSSVMMALMASGFTGQRFAFHGYLPYDKGQMKKMLKSMVSAIQDGVTQIFMETPYRNTSLIKELKLHLPADTRLCIAVDISMPSEEIIRSTIDSLPSNLEHLHKRPAVFLIG